MSSVLASKIAMKKHWPRARMLAIELGTFRRLVGVPSVELMGEIVNRATSSLKRHHLEVSTSSCSLRVAAPMGVCRGPTHIRRGCRAFPVVESSSAKPIEARRAHLTYLSGLSAALALARASDDPFFENLVALSRWQTDGDACICRWVCSAAHMTCAQRR